MGYSERKELYRKLEQLRGHPVITYITSSRGNANGNIAQDATREFVKQLQSFEEKPTNIDLLINSNGGDGLTSWRIITLLREFLGSDAKITCLVPFYAFSAATLLAVGCDEIFLHPLACLGPVDPQMTVQGKDGVECFAYEDVTAYTTFLEEEAGITDQKEKVSLIDRLVEQIKPSSIGASKRASMQSIVMSEKLLKLHMNDEQKAKNIAQKLSKNYFAHGHAVSKKEAKELGLNILDSNEQIEKLIWNIFSDIEKEMKMNEPFDPLSEYLTNQANSGLINPMQSIIMPENTPPELAQQIFLSNCSVVNGIDTNYELKFAVIESSLLSECYISRGKIFGKRLPDMNYQISTVNLSSKWEKL